MTTTSMTRSTAERVKPLTGIRILELGAFVAGPYASSLLCSLGAEVVKVEPPNGGDGFRRGVEVDSHYFVQMNAGKKSIAVNLKAREGGELVRALLPHFDVFIENSRPGKMAALGLGSDDVCRINPAMVYMSVSGFGDGGPWRDRAAYDTIGLSMAGFLSLMSDPGRAQLAGTCIGDLVTGLTATIGILTGLVSRARDPLKRGIDFQTSLLEAVSAITIDAMTQMFETGVTPSRETRHPQAQSFCPRTADGGAIALHLSSSEKFWQSLLRAIDRQDLATDPRFARFYDRMANYTVLRPIVEAEFLKHDRAEWERRLVEADVPFAPVLTINEVATHPQTQWLGLLERGPDGTMLVRAPLRIAGARPSRAAPAPRIGEHTREVACSVLPAAEVERLIAAGVLFQAAERRESGA